MKLKRVRIINASPTDWYLPHIGVEFFVWDKESQFHHSYQTWLTERVIPKKDCILIWEGRSKLEPNKKIIRHKL